MKNRTRGRRHRAAGAAALALTMLLGAAGAAAATEGEPLPEGAAIIDQYIEASGGRAAYEKIENRVTKGKLSIAAMGLEASLTTYAARPNKTYTVMESEALGKMESGTADDIAWEKSMTTGPRLKKDTEKAFMLREAAFDKMLRWRDFYESAECTGVEDVEEKPAYVVVLTPKDGRPQTMYFDKESHLPVRLDMTVETPMGEVPLQTYMSDYREVDGILLSFRTDVKVMGQDRAITVDSVEQNAELPEGTFDIPADIRQLLDKSAATEEPAEEAPAETAPAKVE